MLLTSIPVSRVRGSAGVRGRAPGRPAARVRRASVACALLLALLVAGTAGAQVVPARLRPKLDANLAAVAEALDRGQTPVSSVLALRGRPEDPTVECLVKIGGSAGLSAITAAGGEVGSVHGDVATVAIPADRLGRLAAASAVDYVEGSYRLYPDLNLALPDAHVDVVKSYTLPLRPSGTINVRGAGVYVGVIDGGIAYQHADFCTGTSDNQTRVLWYWIHNITGTPPSSQGFSAAWNYGALYSNTALDAGSCTHTDTGGHGTHVAGIAAGDGSSSTSGYVGCASEASLVVVDYDATQLFDFSGYYGSTGKALDAFDFIRAAAGTHPVVINFSQGTNLGPHDGTTLFEQALNADVDAGSVICVSAGNSAQDNKHISGTVTTSTPLSLTLNYNWATGYPGPVDCWYETNDRLDLTVIDPGGTSHGPYSPTGGQQTFTYESQTCSVTPTVNASVNGDNRWLIQVDQYTNAVKQWTIRFSASSGNSLPDGGQVQCWAERNYTLYWTGGTTDRTLGMPGCAEKVITVAAHVSKSSWTGYDGGTWTYGYTLGTLAPFSARGPTRTGAYQKPEISAPGSVLGSTRSPNYTPTSSPNSLILPDQVHVIMQGTSMSSPMVAGAVALMLQKNAWTGKGSVTPAAIKQSLLNHTRTDSNTGTCPNTSWGYGKLDADAAWNDVPTDAGVSDLRAAVAGRSVKLTWTVTDDIDYAGFNVYRAASVAGSWVKVNSALVPRGQGPYGFTDTTVPLAGGRYFYIIATVDGRGAVRPRASTAASFPARDLAAARRQQLEELATQ